MLMRKRRTHTEGHGHKMMDCFNGGGRARAPRDHFWLVVPVRTGWVKGHPPGALQACEHCVDGLCWPLPSCPEPVPSKGRQWVTYLKGPGEGPTLAGRQAQGDHCSVVTCSHHRAHVDRPPEPHLHHRAHTDRPLELLGGSSLLRVGPQAPVGSLSQPIRVLPQAWSTGGEGGPGSSQSHWAELATPLAELPSCSLPSSPRESCFHRDDSAHSCSPCPPAAHWPHRVRGSVNA